jgi:hypothetical protein
MIISNSLCLNKIFKIHWREFIDTSFSSILLYVCSISALIVKIGDCSRRQHKQTMDDYIWLFSSNMNKCLFSEREHFIYIQILILI